MGDTFFIDTFDFICCIARKSCFNLCGVADGDLNFGREIIGEIVFAD